MLEIMIKCLKGGPTFMFKIIPLHGMDASFLFQQVIQTMDLIKVAGGEIVSVICDGNCTNQKFFKKFNTVVGKP